MHLLITRFIYLLSRYWSPVTAVLFLAIAILSLWPLPALPTIPGTDKSHHFIAYTFLALPAATRKPRHWPVFIILFIVAGGLIEMLQPLANRYAEWLDFAANCAGIGSGSAIGAMLKSSFPCRKNAA